MYSQLYVLSPKLTKTRVFYLKLINTFKKYRKCASDLLYFSRQIEEAKLLGNKDRGECGAASGKQ